MNKTYAFLEIFASIVTLCLFLTGLSKKTRTSKVLLALVFSIFTLLVVDAISWLVYEREELLILYKSLFTIYAVLLALSSVIFHEYVISFIKEKINIRHIKYHLPEINGFTVSIMWILSAFLNILVKFEPNCHYEYTELYYLIESLLGVSMIVDLITLIIHRKEYTKRNFITLIIYISLIFITIPITNLIGSSIITILSMTISILLIYLMTNLETSALLVRKEVEINEKNIDLADKQFKLIYSQIQPHFLYNVLNTIYYLVDDDVEKGKKAIVDFSDYMRMNLDSLNKPMLIKFDDELKKTEIYLSLEKLRFEDELDIVFDIKETNFKIPQLTLQPLIENAVKHGICKKKGGGTVTIYTRSFEKYNEIGVIDDGVGFDTTKEFSKDRSHIGLSNIIYRVEKIANGTVEIHSKINEGTRVIIKLPKEGLYENISR